MIPGVDMWYGWTASQFRSFVPRLKELGVQYIRLEFNASSLANLRNLVPEVVAQGFKVLGLLMNKSYAPTNVNGWGSWVASVVNEFKGYVQLWECWNEPNLTNYFSTADPVQYTAFLKRCYAEAKQADPSCTVLGVSLVFTHTRALTFLRTCYENGAKEAMDMLCCHPYCNPYAPDDVTSTPNPFIYVTKIRDIMEEFGDTRNLWITELGWSSQNGIDQQRQADYTVQALQIAYEWGWVEGYIIYNWIDGGGFYHGLLKADRTPKLVFSAVKTFIWDYIPPPENGGEPPSTSHVTITVTGDGTIDEESGDYPLGSTLIIHSHANEGSHLKVMLRNGVEWTSAINGGFLNLGPIENIEVVFEANVTPPTVTAGIGIIGLIILILIFAGFMLKGGKK